MGVHERLRADTAFGFLDALTISERQYHPQLISNENDLTMLRCIRDELRRSSSFMFSVAFITTDALALLKQELLDYPGKGVIVTSTYLNFNEPAMFRELADLPNVQCFVSPETQSFHAKGYVFRQSHSSTAIIGSSNLTASALLRNREWNLRFSALPDGDIT